MGSDLHLHCDYHDVKGHDTDSCRDLKNAIENMIKQGKLSEYVDKPAERRQRSRSPPPPRSGRARSPQRRNRSPKRRRSPSRERRSSQSRRSSQPRGQQRIVHMIAGGFASGGETSASREVYSAQLSTETVLGKRRYQKIDKTATVSFDDEDLSRITTPHDDALVITAEIANCQIERILVDGGSSSDIMFLQCFEAMGLDKKKIRPINTPLLGFAGRTTYAMGAIRLPMVLGRGRHILKTDTDFIIVDAPATYNVIIGRTTINPNKIVPSTAHQVMRFPSQSGKIGEVRGDQQASRRCYVNVMRRKNQREAMLMEANQDPAKEEKHLEPTGDAMEEKTDGTGISTAR